MTTCWPEIHSWLANPAERESDHKKIITLINNEKPFLLSRLGTGEVAAMHRLDVDLLARHLGVIPATVEQCNKYRERYAQSIRSCNCIGFWRAKKWFPRERRELDLIIPRDKQKFTEVFSESIGDIEFFINKKTSAKAWFGALKGKRVLVVHSFAATMESQYKKRVFDFPQFASIQFYRASNTQSEATDKHQTSWSAELARMEVEIGKLEFDIALIGCGAYSSPLGFFIKDKMGKSAIIMGGALQLFFGIYGERWISHPDYAHLRAHWNDKWVRPAEEERPKNFKKIENGAYW